MVLQVKGNSRKSLLQVLENRGCYKLRHDLLRTLLDAMHDDTYLTIEARAEGLYKEKGSKFIAFAFPVADEEAIKNHLEDLKKQYYDARHHCYAYRLGKEGMVFRANDAGEPNHSAGDPILGQIRSNELTNVLVVVVRYFGGTKLGVSGLINAYKTAAAAALANSNIITQTFNRVIKVTFDYLAMNEIMGLIKTYGVEIKQQNFGNNSKMRLSIREGMAEELLQKFLQIENVTAEMERE